QTPAMTHSPFLRGTLAGPRGGPALPVCRLGLATRGDSQLTPDDVFRALDAGVNFLNWCGTPDALSAAVAALGPRRKDVAVCVQLAARTAAEAKDEFAGMRAALGTDRLDVVTFYYVEEPGEWEQIVGPGGALEYVEGARRDGAVGLVGLTSHQRRLAAEAGRNGHLDLLMVRYNAAHTGAERVVFPVAREVGLGGVVYTCPPSAALPR